MARFEPSLLASDAAVRQSFLDALQATGSVVAAARLTGVARSTARNLRKRDRGFAEAYAAALGKSVGADLEAALLQRAIHGVERYRFHANNTVEIWVEHDNRLAFQLLAKLIPAKYGAAAGTAATAPRPVMTRAEFIAVIRAQPRLDPPLPGGEDDALIGHDA